MGATYYKKTIQCDGGCEYGSCDKKSVFVLRYNRSVDTGTIFIKRHIEDENSKFISLGTFTDDEMEALSDIINSKEGESISRDEQNEIKDSW